MALDLVRDGSASALDGVEARLVFAVRGAEKPYAYAGPPPEGVPPSRGESVTRAVRVKNARPIARTFKLDVEGFAVVHRPTAVRDFWDEAQTLGLGHPETADLVKDVTGASRVIVYDHTLRRRADGVDDRTPGGRASPQAGFMSIRQSIPARKGCATFWAIRPRNA